MNKKIFIALFLIFAVFVSARFLVIGDMYHQDEYKWAMIADPSFGLDLESDHPPVIALLYRITGLFFGFDHLRLLPFIFSLANLVLIFVLVKRLFDKKAGLFSAGIFSISVYGVLSSVQVDIDGAILPFAFLSSVLFYSLVNLEQPLSGPSKKWFFALIFSLAFGFLVKLSFILVPMVIATDYLLTSGRFRRFSNWLRAAFVFFIPATIAFLTIFFINWLFEVGNSSRFLVNAGNFGFLEFSGRNYWQIVFLGLKTAIMASPILIFPIFFVLFSFDNIRRFRIFLIYIAYNLLFYLVIFDFTSRTIERYMMFLIAPASIMAGVVLSEVFSGYFLTRKKIKVFFWLGAILGFFALAFFIWTRDFSALPLNPKTAYLDKFQALDFGFLVPITGGSGPVGFYVPAFFPIIFFFIGIFLSTIIFYPGWEKLRQIGAVTFLSLCLVYNVFVFIEYFSGRFWGSAKEVAEEIMNKATESKEVEKVITYYDTGAWELNQSGKYFKRFYTDPMFAESNRGKFFNYDGYFAVVDFPMIDKEGVYWSYFRTCRSIYSFYDKKIKGHLLDCKFGDRSVFAGSNI